MKRFNLGEKVTLEPIPQKDNLWGKEAKYQPYERIRQKAKNGWQLIERYEDDTLSFYCENAYTKQTTNSEAGGLEAYGLVCEEFDFYKNMPPGAVVRGLEQQQTPRAEPPAAKTEKELQAEKSEAALKKVEASFKEMDAKLKAGEAEFNAEMTRRKFNEMKASMSELEKQMHTSTPEGSSDDSE